MPINREVEPILIASVKHNRLLFSTTTFRDILSKVGSRPVSVVSITYPNGEEKDQIFNEILKYMKTVDINDNRRETLLWKTRSEGKGIYIWPEPIIIKKSCQEVAVLLMEVNGCFDPMGATREDLMLFALNCVLSSTLIYGFENQFWSEIQEFLLLFGKYGCGGLDSQLSDSFLNLVLMVKDWKSTKLYPFGYHDSSTSPANGSNYKKAILDSELAENKNLKEDMAFMNSHFTHNFHRIGFCLMPGNDSEILDQNSNPICFGELWEQITTRLFHPSHLPLKFFAHKKVNGNQLVRLFEEICAFMTENDTQSLSSDQLIGWIRDVRALSAATNYYKMKMNKEIEDKEYLKDFYLIKWHNESRNNALKLFDDMRGTTDRKEPSRDRFYDLLDNEIQNVWHFYEDLNRSKSEVMTAHRISNQVIIDMVEQILHKKKEFNTKPNGVDTEVSQLVGISLEGLSTAVRTTIDIK